MRIAWKKMRTTVRKEAGTCLVNAVVGEVHRGLIDVGGRRRLVLLRADANLIFLSPENTVYTRITGSRVLEG